VFLDCGSWLDTIQTSLCNHHKPRQVGGTARTYLYLLAAGTEQLEQRCRWCFRAVMPDGKIAGCLATVLLCYATFFISSIPLTRRGAFLLPARNLEHFPCVLFLHGAGLPAALPTRRYSCRVVPEHYHLSLTPAPGFNVAPPVLLSISSLATTHLPIIFA